MKSYLDTFGLSPVTGEIVAIIPNNYYLTKGGKVLKVLKTYKRQNRAVVFRYDTFKEDRIHLDAAPDGLEPLFKIGEVARAVRRKTDTIRRYERSGLLPRAKKIYLNAEKTASLRLYTQGDLIEVARFFATRPPPGRQKENPIVGISEKEIKEFIKTRFENFKRMEKK